MPGTMDDDDKDAALIGFSEGEIEYLGGKPDHIGSGGNYNLPGTSCSSFKFRFWINNLD